MEQISIGKILRKRREELALTQRQVANHVGVTEAAVSRWESGEIANMRRDRIVNLASILQISPMLIMGAPEFYGKPPTLSFEQATILDEFDSMNREGQKMALGLIKSLRVAHPKETVQTTDKCGVVQKKKNSRQPNIIHNNQHNFSGTNILNLGNYNQNGE